MSDPSEVPKPETKHELTVSEAGRIGGRRRAEKAGPEELAKMGRKGGNTTKRRYGKEFYKMIGSHGGRSTRRKYGDEHFTELGKQGGDRLKELVEKGKEAIAKEATHESKHSDSD